MSNSSFFLGKLSSVKAERISKRRSEHSLRFFFNKFFSSFFFCFSAVCTSLGCLSGKSSCASPFNSSSDWSSSESSCASPSDSKFYQDPKGKYETSVWFHFLRSKSTGEAQCKYCKHILQTKCGSTSSLWAHLHQHPDVTVKKLPNDPKAPQISKVIIQFFILFKGCPRWSVRKFESL